MSAARRRSHANGAQYFPNGAVKQFTYGNGIVHTLTQSVRQLPDVSKDAFGANRVFEVDLDFDANGNVVSSNDLADANRNRSMTYDNLDRLLTASAPGLWGTASYTYDVLDNLRTTTLGAASYTYSYDANNRVQQIARSGTTPWNYTTDLRGNVTADGRNNYTFTRGNRLAGVTGKETYQYDGHGRRTVVWRQNGTAMVPVYGMDGTLRYTADNQKGGGTSQVYLGDDPVAEVFWNWTSGTQTTTYTHTDSLGSPIATTDASRNVIDRNEFAPYGLPINSTVDGVGYTGHVMDQSTGLIYMQQRYYDPAVGRFLSTDPKKTDTKTGLAFNPYSYGNNNPYLFVDPDGRANVLGVVAKYEPGFEREEDPTSSDEKMLASAQKIVDLAVETIVASGNVEAMASAKIWEVEVNPDVTDAENPKTIAATTKVGSGSDAGWRTTFYKPLASAARANSGTVEGLRASSGQAYLRLIGLHEIVGHGNEGNFVLPYDTEQEKDAAEKDATNRVRSLLKSTPANEGIE